MSDPNQEEQLYAQAASELDGGKRDEGLWAKCFAECDGDENKAKALYLKTRVGRLAEEPSTPKKSTKEKKAGPSEKPAPKPTDDESESSVEKLNREYAEEQKAKQNQTADDPPNEKPEAKFVLMVMGIGWVAGILVNATFIQPNQNDMGYHFGAGLAFSIWSAACAGVAYLLFSKIPGKSFSRASFVSCFVLGFILMWMGKSTTTQNETGRSSSVEKKEKLLGTYENKDEFGSTKIVFLGNGTVEQYERNSEKKIVTKWTLVGKEVRIGVGIGGYENYYSVWRIEDNGGLTKIAGVTDGNRIELPELGLVRQTTYKKLK